MLASRIWLDCRPRLAVLLSFAALMSAGVALAAHREGLSAHWIAYTLPFAALVSLVAVVDAEVRQIPDIVSAALALLGGLMVWTTGADCVVHLGTGVLFGLIFLGFRWFGTRGSAWIGEGDLLVLASISIWLGPYWTLISVFLTAIGALILFGLRVTSYSRQVPFATVLAYPSIAIWCLGG